jgi:hypothetical protein
MNKLTSVLAAVLVIGSTSLALADDPAIDQVSDAMRNYGPVVSQTLTTRPVALPRHNKAQTDVPSWTDQASQPFGFGGN